MLLQGCFEQEPRRPSAGLCRARLISLWERQSPWADYERALQRPRPSPCVHQWGDVDRVSMFYRVCRLTAVLLITRYEQAPHKVKTCSHIKRYLVKLREKERVSLQKIAQYSEKIRQQKYKTGAPGVTAEHTTASSASHEAITHYSPMVSDNSLTPEDTSSGTQQF